MINVIKRILKIGSYHQLNTIEISQNNLIQNFKYLSRLQKKVKIAPVLKSNAYGHGSIQIAKVLDNLNLPFFCVDSIYEAYVLLKAKIKTPILIMGFIDPLNLQVKKLPFSYAVWDLNMINAIDKFQKGSSVHIFVDTGMHREGIPIDELSDFLKVLKQANVKISGLMSHLACGDKPNDPLTKLQIKNFQEAIRICKEFKIKPRWIHLQNSDGFLNLKIPECNMARCGLALYGITPSVIARSETTKQSISESPNKIATTRQGGSRNDSLRPVLQLKTKLIQIKSLQKGDRIGYDGIFTAKKSMILGVLPLGYYDGVDRRLSNKGFVKLNGSFCRVIGRISMNVTTIDISGVKDAKVGDEVTVYSKNPSDLNSISNCANICKTIPYDLLVHLASSTKRIIV